MSGKTSGDDDIIEIEHIIGKNPFSKSGTGNSKELGSGIFLRPHGQDGNGFGFE